MPVVMAAYSLTLSVVYRFRVLNEIEICSFLGCKRLNHIHSPSSESLLCSGKNVLRVKYAVKNGVQKTCI